jgi:hypothetical protein
MHDQPTPGLELDRLERALLDLLTLEPPGLWSVGELAQATGNPLGTEDALVELHANGLIHRLHQFVFLTRAAVRARQLEDTT